MRAAAPTLGSATKAPGKTRDELVIASRDTGPGVFGAYTPDGSHVRLLRYGGGTVAVGKLKGVDANVMGVATGLGGRIWVMWGQDGMPVAVTRSNKAVARFEPIQRVNPDPFTLYRLSGDGRLGPLDLFVDQIPSSKKTIPPSGTFYARVLPSCPRRSRSKRSKQVRPGDRPQAEGHSDRRRRPGGRRQGGGPPERPPRRTRRASRLSR